MALLVFIVLHLAGNLLLYSKSSVPFNIYANSLDKLGALKEIGELGLFILFSSHAIVALWVTFRNRSSKGPRYTPQKSKKGPSRFNLSSTKMAVSGTILLFFLILHVYQFTLGPSIDQGYVTQINGENVRDLYRLVAETFQNPFYVGLYVVVMVFLGMHLRHAFWSWMQSLGVMAPRWSSTIYTLGFLFALVIAVGFLGIPIWLYMGATL